MQPNVAEGLGRLTQHFHRSKARLKRFDKPGLAAADRQLSRIETPIRSDVPCHIPGAHMSHELTVKLLLVLPRRKQGANHPCQADRPAGVPGFFGYSVGAPRHRRTVHATTHWCDATMSRTASSARHIVENVGLALPALGSTAVLAIQTFESPRSRRFPSTTPSSSPILQVPTGW